MQTKFDQIDELNWKCKRCYDLFLKENLKTHWSECTGLYQILFMGEADSEYQEMDGFIIGSLDKIKKDFYKSVSNFAASFHDVFVPKSIQEIEMEKRNLKIDGKDREVITFFLE